MKSNGATVINVPAEKSPSTSKATLAAPAAVVATTKATKLGGGWKRGVAMLDFLLRLLAIASTLSATIAMGTSDQTLPFFTQHFRFRANFSELPALTFFVVANGIASGYLILSLPFSLVSIIRPHLVGARCLLFIIDTVMVAFTAAASASAAAIVYLAHVGNRKANWVEICQQFNEFCKQTSGSVVASFIGTVIFIVLVLMAALAFRKH